MRFQFTSVERAKTLAKNLRRLAADAGIGITLSRARDVLAGMLGYRDWAEFDTITGRHDRPPSPFDELLEPQALRQRLWDHSVVLAEAVGIEPGGAATIVAGLRATAHPAGPHRLTGPSSLPLPWPVAYRGWAPSGHILQGFRMDRSKPWDPERPFDAAPPGGGAPDLAAQLVLDQIDFGNKSGHALTGDGRIEWIDAEQRLGDLWKVRGTALIRALMLALAWKRNHEGLDLSWSAVRAHLGVEAIERMAGQESLPPLVRFLLADYLAMLPGYEAGRPLRRTTADQHGYLQMQAVKAVGEVASLHGNLLFAADIDVGTAGAWITATMTPPPETGDRSADADLARSIVAGTTTKIFLRLDEPDQSATMTPSRP